MSRFLTSACTYSKAWTISRSHCVNWCVTVYQIRRMGNVIPVFKSAEEWHPRCALIDQNGSHTYGGLLAHSSQLALRILDFCGARDFDLKERNISILCPNDSSFIISNWATWMSGGAAVPLCRNHPASELEYFVKDSQSSLLIATREFEEIAQAITSKTKTPHLILDAHDYFVRMPPPPNNKAKVDQLNEKLDSLVKTVDFGRRNAVIIYTSGTTGKPKGVVLTHNNVYSQVEMMRVNWDWSKNDVVLHCLPLHHIHGYINLLLTSNIVGATCIMLPKFDVKEVWHKLVHPIISDKGDHVIHVSVFMAVPTVYVKLIEYYNKQWRRGRGTKQTRQYIKSACQSRVRLMVSGSSALPQPVMEEWEEITGHVLLERYGMSELGMVLTNPLKGTRIPGTVGNPFPGVEVCIAKQNVYAPNGYDIIAHGTSRSTQETPGMEGESGELYVKGPGVFKHYFNKPEVTNASFTKDLWFKSGDTMCFVDGVYKILGRTSVDVIKSGGYKISALEVERQLLAHPDISDCCVVGLPDITWGQRVAAVLILHDDVVLELSDLRQWAKDRMPFYQIPSVIRVLSEMPRNHMGKINKKQIVKDVFPEAVP